MMKELTLAQFKAYCESFDNPNYLFESKKDLPCVVISNRYSRAVFAVHKGAIRFYATGGTLTLYNVQKIELGPMVENYYQLFTVTCGSGKGQIKHEMMLTV